MIVLRTMIALARERLITPLPGSSKAIWINDCQWQSHN